MVFVREHVLPGGNEFKREMDAFRAAGNPWQGTQDDGAAEGQGAPAGLWNMFLPDRELGAGLTNLEYAPLCEIMGRYPLARRGVQLLGARHRQHGDARALRHAPSRRSAG